MIEAFQLHLTVAGAAQAADWYRDALGAVERSRIELPDGRLIHLELAFGGLTAMVADEFPEYRSLSPASLGGTYGAVYLFFDDVRAAWDRAVAAGAEVLRPLGDAFWGDLDGQLADPFGHRWGLAQHVRTVSLEEMTRLAADAFQAPGH